MGKIFISHSSKDKDEACDLATRLGAQGYDDIFLDVDPEDGIHTGEAWEQILYDSLKLCRALIVLCSTHSMASHWCFAEITHARALGKNIFPIQLEPCQVFSLLRSHYQILDFGRFESKDAARAVLWRDLEVAGLKEDLPFDAKKPYPGLDAFEATDAGVFFGRETEIEEVRFRLEAMHRWREPRLAVVLGASGSGKSSLVRAGVLPRLQRDATRWIALPPFRPGDRPLDELARTLGDAFPGGRDWQVLREDFRRAAALLASDASRDGAAAPSPLIDLAVELKQAVRRTEGAEEKSMGDGVVLLVVDQFEELLNATDAGEAHAFLRLLRAALRGKGLPLMVLATLRSDFFGVFQTHPELQDVDFREWSLGPMPHERLEAVILKPAAKVGVEFEEGLVGRIIAETKTADVLPLLAFTLRELYEKYGKDKRLEIDEYEALGGVETAVAKVAQGIVENLSEEKEKILRSAFLQMVRISEGQFVRRKARWDQIPEQAHALLNAFIDRRLLVKDGETVEVTHEALFRVWDQLKGWLDQNRDFLLWQERLREAHRAWRDTQRDEGSLLRGAALAEAERWLAEQVNLEPDERTFIEESLAARERARAMQERRRRRTLQATMGAAALFLVLGAIALLQWQRAEDQFNRATAQRLGVLGQATLDGTYDSLVDAVLLAAESLKREMTAEGFAAWARGMSLLPRKPVHTFDAGRERGLARQVRSVAFSPDGRVLAVAADKAVFLLDARTRTVLDTLHTRDYFSSVAFSPDGRFLAGSHGGTGVWDAEGWRLRKEFPYLGALAFSPDGGLLAMASISALPRLVETANWSERPLDTEYPKKSVAFSPDGKWLAMGGVGNDGVGLWDVATGRLVARNQGPGNTSGVAFLSASRLVTANTSGVLQLFILRQEGDTIRLEEADAVRQGEEVLSLAVSKEESLLLSAGLGDYPRGIARLWRLDPVGGFYEVGRLGHDERVDAVAFDPVSGAFVTAAGSTVFTWPAGSASAAFASLEHGAAVQDVAFSPDGRWLVAGGADSTASVIETDTWRRVERLVPAEVTQEILFTPGGRWLALVGSTVARVYDTTSWREYRVLEGPKPITDAFLSPKGAWLVLLGDSLIQPYETGSWQEQPPLHVAERLVEIHLSPDALRLRTLIEIPRPDGEGRGARIEHDPLWQTWELRTGENVATSDSLTGRWQTVWPERVRQVSPDGRWRFDNPGFDSYANPHALFYLEDVVTGDRVAQWKHTDLAAHAFSPDSRWLATAGRHGGIRVWPLRADDMVRMAGERLPRNLSPERFREYFGDESYVPTFEHLPIP